MIHANLRPTTGAILLFIWVSNAAALTLERSPGSVFLGRPLEFNVQATVSAGEQISSLCLEADVFQADTLIKPNRVSVQLLKTGNNGVFTLRVSSSSIVEEPVLTVVVKHGCLTKNSRRYVVFANPPTESFESASTVSSEPAFFPPPATQLAPTTGSSRIVAETSEAVRLASKKKTTSIEPSSLVQPSRTGLSTSVKNIKPQLRLESIDPGVDLTTRLKSTLELVVAPSSLPSTQRTEAAALWRVISAQSEDLKQDIQRLTSIEVETVALREASSKSRAEFARISAELKVVENNRYQNPLVYVLAAILAFLLATLAFMRFGSKNDNVESAWWKLRRDKNEPGGELRSVVLKEASIAKGDAQQHESTIPFKTKSVSRVDERNAADVQPSQLKFKSSESAYATFGVHGNARGVNVEELFDIQQQADFFISLGQHDQAIEVLQNHLRENAQTSPLVYLDLIKLYHRMDMLTDYQDLAAEFTRLFNVDMPGFDAFQDKTRGLEAYQATLTHITSVWHTDKVLKTIENYVFREEGRISEALGLEAYTELLLLHSIAKDLLENQVFNDDANDQFLLPKSELPLPTPHASGLVPQNFHQTIPQKLKLIVNIDSIENINNDTRSSFFQKPVGARIGLDIDLTTNNANSTVEKLAIFGERSQSEERSQIISDEFVKFDLESFAITANVKSP